MKNTFPKTVFRTPDPKFESSEVYEISIKPVPGDYAPHECWIIREMHGYPEETTKKFQYVVETIDPQDKRSFLTCEEAVNQANERVLFLARSGFRFLFVANYKQPSPPWYECYELVTPDGEYRPLSQPAVAVSAGYPSES